MKLLKCPEKFISPFRIYTYKQQIFQWHKSTGLKARERERRSWEPSNSQDKVFLAGSSHEYKLSTLLFCTSFSVLKTFFSEIASGQLHLLLLRTNNLTTTSFPFQIFWASNCQSFSILLSFMPKPPKS